MPDTAERGDVYKRQAVYTILDNPKYSHFFEFIVIAEKKRITKESFRKFLEGQDRYKLDPVSYTHLDVYKRQLNNNGLWKVIPLLF